MDARRHRSIPAYAGNSSTWKRGSPLGNGPSPRMRGTDGASGPIDRQSAVHPRVCGEQATAAATTAMAALVHPRVCGEQAAHTWCDRRGSSVHPRVCGEQGVGHDR